MIDRLRAWRRRRNRVAEETCFECFAMLNRRRDVWEVQLELANGDVAELAGMPGGTRMTATYCRKHRPTGARRLG